MVICHRAQRLLISVKPAYNFIFHSLHFKQTEKSIYLSWLSGFELDELWPIYTSTLLSILICVSGYHSVPDNKLYSLKEKTFFFLPLAFIKVQMVFLLVTETVDQLLNAVSLAMVKIVPEKNYRSS